MATPNVARTVSELDDVREQVAQEDLAVADADHPGRRHELRLAQREELAANEPAAPGQPSRPMTAMTETRLGPTAGTNTITRSSVGMLMTVSWCA